MFRRCSLHPVRVEEMQWQTQSVPSARRVCTAFLSRQSAVAPRCGADVFLMWMSESSQAAPLDLRHPQSGPNPQPGTTAGRAPVAREIGTRGARPERLFW